MRKLILKCDLSLGDIVLMTAAVRDLHAWYPGQFVTDVRTCFPEVWDNNPHLTPIKDADPDAELIQCSYPLIDFCNETPYHCVHGFIEFLNKRLHLGMKPTRFKGDIYLSEQEKAWYSQVHEVTGAVIPFWIVAAGGKYDVTIKWWESRRYQEVIDHFRGRIQFVQVGSQGHHHPRLEGVIDLRGKTGIRELIRLVHHSDGILGSVTAVMHLAAAVESRPGIRGERSCVVISGGREPAHWEAYPGHQFIHTTGALECCLNGGCWKNRTFPLRDGDERDHSSHRCLNVVGDLPRCMDMISASEVIRRTELYFANGRRKFLTSRQRKAAEQGIVATATNNFDHEALNLHSAGMACDRFIQSIRDNPRAKGAKGNGLSLNDAKVRWNNHTNPSNRMGRIPFPSVVSSQSKERGIVICGGGVRYFTSAWVCINILRDLGCALPIEFWYLGKAEMDDTMTKLLSTYGVRCIDAFQIRKRFPIRRLRGWELKPYAMLQSSFHEILLLDADNVPVRNPEFLFESCGLTRTGAIFWPDYEGQNDPRAKPIWRSCGLRRPNEPEFETGQILVDKARCLEALSLTVWFNANSDFYYRHLHGDKETFHLAFRKLKQPYSLVPHPVISLQGVMCQHDFEGRRIFQHRNADKWDLTLKNKCIAGFLLEAECREHIRRLRKLWDGKIVEIKKRRKFRPGLMPIITNERLSSPGV